MFNVIILAGGRGIKGIDEGCNKALVKINGVPMIEYVIEALKDVKNVGKIAAVGPKKEIEQELKDKVSTIVDGGGNIVENVIAGIKALKDDSKILVTSSDIPMISKEAIEEFIEESEQSGADFCYPIVNKIINDEQFPGIKRTYVRTREGTFTGGNVIYINPKVLKNGREIGEKLFQARKSPVRIAAILGIGFVAGLLTGTLSIQKLEKKFSDILGIKAKAIISNYPSIGNDVDKKSDLIYAQKRLSNLRA